MMLRSKGTIMACVSLALVMHGNAAAQEQSVDALRLDRDKAHLNLPLHFPATPGGGETIHLWGDGHTIGVQSSTTYLRSNESFAWFKKGEHAENRLDPGPGGTVLMSLADGDLNVSGRVTAEGDLEAENVVVRGSVEAEMGTVPKGAVLMWSGQIKDIPSGWRLADGAPGTHGIVNGVTVPDLRGRFVVGYQDDDPDYRQVHGTGGAKTTALPSHQHGLNKNEPFIGPHNHGPNVHGSGPTHDTGTGDEVTQGISADPDPSENRPPYIVLAYIVYVGG